MNHSERDAEENGYRSLLPITELLSSLLQGVLVGRETRAFIHASSEIIIHDNSIRAVVADTSDRADRPSRLSATPLIESSWLIRVVCTKKWSEEFLSPS
jgi:hypothetical protein